MTMHPTRSDNTDKAITYGFKQTSLGLMAMAATTKGVCFVQFGEDEDALLTALKKEFPKSDLAATPAQSTTDLTHWITALDQHISQGKARPDIPLDIRGTTFQRQVWQSLLHIPVGEVLSYSQLAERIGKPKAFRAAASACGANRIGVLIPCHRVLRGDGGLGGYRWGLDRKAALLKSEKSSMPH